MRRAKKAGGLFKLKFHRFKISKVCSDYGTKIILIGFALFIANPHKITFGRRYSLDEKIYNFSMIYSMRLILPQYQKRETSVFKKFRPPFSFLALVYQSCSQSSIQDTEAQSGGVNRC